MLNSLKLSYKDNKTLLYVVANLIMSKSLVAILLE